MRLSARFGTAFCLLLVLCCAVQSSVVPPVDEPGQVTPGQIMPE